MKGLSLLMFTTMESFDKNWGGPSATGQFKFDFDQSSLGLHSTKSVSSAVTWSMADVMWPAARKGKTPGLGTLAYECQMSVQKHKGT